MKGKNQTTPSEDKKRIEKQLNDLINLGNTATDPKLMQKILDALKEIKTELKNLREQTEKLESDIEKTMPSADDAALSEKKLKERENAEKLLDSFMKSRKDLENLERSATNYEMFFQKKINQQTESLGASTTSTEKKQTENKWGKIAENHAEDYREENDEALEEETVGESAHISRAPGKEDSSAHRISQAEVEFQKWYGQKYLEEGQPFDEKLVQGKGYMLSYDNSTAYINMTKSGIQINNVHPNDLKKAAEDLIDAHLHSLYGNKDLEGKDPVPPPNALRGQRESISIDASSDAMRAAIEKAAAERGLTVIPNKPSVEKASVQEANRENKNTPNNETRARDYALKEETKEGDEPPPSRTPG